MLSMKQLHEVIAYKGKHVQIRQKSPYILTAVDLSQFIGTDERDKRFFIAGESERQEAEALS